MTKDTKDTDSYIKQRWLDHSIDEDQELSMDDQPNDAAYWYVHAAMTRQGEKMIIREGNVIYVQF